MKATRISLRAKFKFEEEENKRSDEHVYLNCTMHDPMRGFLRNLQLLIGDKEQLHTSSLNGCAYGGRFMNPHLDPENISREVINLTGASWHSESTKI